MALASGTKLGPYEIVAPLGAGGMGEVYRARDIKLGRDVALKVLPASFTLDAERLARFEREAKVLAALNHPNIAAIYGFEDSGEAALAMELAEGLTLGERLAKGRIGLEEALPIARQISEGLEYAHERGIVHRDLKPANIKITPEGTVKLLDFGLARAVQDESTLVDISSSPTFTAMATQAGMILGTAAYMSPEQAKGKSTDRRADIWAFGCVLFEMLSGKMAFSGETVTDTLAEVIKTDPDWRSLPAGTPAGIRRLIQRCLKKDVKQRLQAIGDARIAIEEALAGGAADEIQSLGSAPAAIRQASRLRRAMPWMAALVAGIAGLATGIALRAPRAAAMHFRAVTNLPGVQAEPALSPDGRSVAFVSNRDGYYNIYVSLLAGGKLVQITTGPNVKSRPRWSPDGTTLAYGELNDSGVWDIWQVAALGGTPRRIILNAKDPAWSPDGRLLAYEDGLTRALWMADVSGQNPRQLTHEDSEWWMQVQPAFSPDGRHIAFIERSGGPYGSLSVLNLDGGGVRELSDHNSLALSPAWSPDGRYIYFASGRSGTMNIWKIPATGGAPEQITSGQGDDAQLDVSADGRRIVFTTVHEQLNIMQRDIAGKSGEPVKPLTDDPARNQLAPAYSPDGQRIAYFSNFKGVEKEGIWVSNADGSDPVQVVQDKDINIYPRWTDSQHLVYLAEPSTGASGEYRSVAISGGAPAMLVKGWDHFLDSGPNHRLLFMDRKREFLSFSPGDAQPRILGHCPASKECREGRWSPAEDEIGYIVMPRRENDPDEGVWITNFHDAPRQVFRGWTMWFARGPGNQIYILQNKADLTGTVWRVGWDGKGLTRVATLPLIYSYWNVIERESQGVFDISPNGHDLAFIAQRAQQANIGMLESSR